MPAELGGFRSDPRRSTFGGDTNNSRQKCNVPVLFLSSSLSIRLVFWLRILKEKEEKRMREREISRVTGPVGFENMTIGWLKKKTRRKKKENGNV